MPSSGRCPTIWPPSEFVAALRLVFGGEPAVEEYPGSCCESRATTFYRWDEFQVGDDHMGHFADDDHSVWIPEDGPDYVNMNLYVQVAGPVVRGVAVTTAPGFEVGEDVGELAGRLGEPYDGNGYDEVPIETGPELGPPEIEGRANAYSVVIWDDGNGRRPIRRPRQRRRRARLTGLAPIGRP